MKKNFKQWLIENYLGQDSPEGDVAMDINDDINFPDSTPRAGFKYLRKFKACVGCLRAYINICREWKKGGKVV